MRILEIILWLAIASAIYSIVVYPALAIVLGRLCRRNFRRQRIEPPVSLIVSAFNEEAVIAAKIENSLALDYPSDKLELIVASDGSTDKTDEIVRGYADRNVRLVRYEGGMGKSAVLNEVAPEATGEILIFSDATGMYSENAVADLVHRFADPRVGCVSGRVGYTYDGSLASKGFGFYQRYVLAVRRAEGASGAAILGSGSIHAVRREAYRPGPPDTFMDMVDPLHSAMLGFANTFAEEAISWEEVRVRTGDEYRARLRIGLRVWKFVAYALPRLPVFRAPLFCFQLVSHKLLRWAIGPSLVLILLLNLLLLGEGWIYWVLLAGQVLYYGMTLLGLASTRLGSKIPGLSGLIFFNSTNLAYLVSLVRFLRGRRVTQWVPSR